jgi:hypothetical protein
MDGPACWEPVKPTPSMIREAVRRVEEGFAFIGLAEKWCLSVCLFHEMFGGGFHESEFIKLRSGRAASSGEVEDLRHYEDVADRVVYHRAKLIFEQRLDEWRVHETQCARRHCEEEMWTVYFVPVKHFAVVRHRKLLLRERSHCSTWY